MPQIHKGKKAGGAKLSNWGKGLRNHWMPHVEWQFILYYINIFHRVGETEAFHLHYKG